MIKSGEFASPTFRPTRTNIFQTQVECYGCGDLSQSSPSTKASSRISDCEMSSLQEESISPCDEFLQGIQSSKDKKTKKLVKTLQRFEDNAILGGFLQKQQALLFRSQVYRMLAACLAKCEQMRFQQYESICLSILLNTVIRSNLSIKEFLKVATATFDSKHVKLGHIRKSRCFESVQQISLDIFGARKL